MGEHVVTMVQLIMGEHVFAILNDQRYICPLGFPARFVNSKEVEALGLVQKNSFQSLVDFVGVFFIQGLFDLGWENVLLVMPQMLEPVK